MPNQQKDDDLTEDEKLQKLLDEAQATLATVGGKTPQQYRDQYLNDIQDAQTNPVTDPAAAPPPTAPVGPIDQAKFNRHFALPWKEDKATGEVSPAIPGALYGANAMVEGAFHAIEHPIDTAQMALEQLKQGMDKVAGSAPSATPPVVDETTPPTQFPVMPMLGLGSVINMPAISQSLTLPTVGTKLGPTIMNQMRAWRAAGPPTVKNVSAMNMAIDAPKDLETLEKAQDVWKTYWVDSKAVLADLGERAGIPNLADLKGRLDQNTQISGQMRVNDTLRTGNLRTASGDYVTKGDPIAKIYTDYKALPEPKQVDIDQYLKYGDVIDDLRLRLAKGTDPTSDVPMLAQALRSQGQIAARTPEAVEFAKNYAHSMEATRNFLGSGPNAMIGQKGLADLATNRRNYVPLDVADNNTGLNFAERAVKRDKQENLDPAILQDWYLHHRDIYNKDYKPSIMNRNNAIDTLVDYTNAALKAKMENDTRGAYVSGIRDSKYGQNTIIPMPDEDGARMKYGNRTITVYENGDKKHYVGSQLQSDLLRFDPNFAKHPWMYATKRLIELGTTGPLGGFFALTNAMRDTLTGNIIRDPGMGTPGILRTIGEVPATLAAKTARGVSELLDSSFGQNVPFLTPSARANLATTLGDWYNNSMHARANMFGGVDSSQLHSPIRINSSTIGELQDTLANIGSKVPTGTFLGHSIKNMWDGWNALFGAVSDASRSAAFRNSIKKGVPEEVAVEAARRSAGDMLRVGKVFRGDSRRITADAVNPTLQFGERYIGGVASLAREGIPWINPQIQGLRRVGQGLITDPVGTMARSFAYIGIPTVAAYAWNKAISKDNEYNEYAHKFRSLNDQTSNIYLGVPGMDPRYGTEWAIPQEFQGWSMFGQAVHNLASGEPDIMRGVGHLGAQWLKNSLVPGYPVVNRLSFNAAGYHAPDTILDPADDVYKMREDNSGFMPQNVETVIRGVFGSLGDVVLHAAAAAHEGGPEAFAKEFAYQFSKHIPIVRNVAGTKTAVSSFTPESDEKFAKVDALNEFLDRWGDYNDPSRVNRTRDSLLTKNEDPGVDPDLHTTARVAPLPGPTPLNPVYQTFGDVIKQYFGTNEQGMTGLNAHYTAVTKLLNQLKTYSAGTSKDFVKYKKDVIDGSQDRYVEELDKLAADTSLNKKQKNSAANAIEKQYGEMAKLDRLLQEKKTDFSNRNSVNDLIDYLERDRSATTDEQLSVIKSMEDYMTQQLQKSGALPPNVRFDVTKHLGVNVPKDFRMPSPPSVQLPGH